MNGVERFFMGMAALGLVGLSAATVLLMAHG